MYWPRTVRLGPIFWFFYALVSQQDQVIAVHPTYQQLYSIPASFGAEVKQLNLRAENGYLPDLDELEFLVNARTPYNMY